jgi:hypothetical protein
MRNQGFQTTPNTDETQFPVARLNKALLKVGFALVSPAEIERFHALADELIDGEIADPHVLARVQAWTGRALHWRTDERGGDAILASIPLTDRGVTALLEGRFGFANARRDWVCAPAENPGGLLSWGLGGRSVLDQAASVRALLVGWQGFYSNVRVYARARSRAGEDLMARLRFRPLNKSCAQGALFASHGVPNHLDRLMSRRGLAVPEEMAV